MKLASSKSAGSFTAIQLAEIVGVPVEDVAKWISHALLTPCTTDPEPLFDFRQLSFAQSLRDLSASGATLRKLKQEMKRLGGVAATSAPVIGEDGRVYARDGRGNLLDTSNQLCLEFGADGEPISIAKTAGEWYECGVQQEVDGRLDRAIACYREALLTGGPDPLIGFALAHALAAIGQTEASVERYRQVIELDPKQATAWNNLGVELANLKRWDEARDALRRAIELCPSDAGARYNLADTLEEAGEPAEASEHWREFLKLERSTERAAYARRRLTAS